VPEPPVYSVDAYVAEYLDEDTLLVLMRDGQFPNRVILAIDRAARERRVWFDGGARGWDPSALRVDAQRGRVVIADSSNGARRYGILDRAGRVVETWPVPREY
jgi:hypothetical protein